MSSQSTELDPSKRKRQRHAMVEDGGSGRWPLVITPPKQWHYAVEFPIPDELKQTGSGAVEVTVTVLQGEISVASMAPHNTLLRQSVRNTNDRRTTVTLSVSDLAQCHSVIVRNAWAAGRSVVQIHRVAVLQEVGEPEPSEPQASGLLAVFSPSNFARHDDAAVSFDGGSEWPLVVTTLTPSLNSLSYAVDEAHMGNGPVSVAVELTVLRGEVSIVCAGQNDEILTQQRRTAGERSTVSLQVADLSRCIALVFRNEAAGRSVFELYGVSAIRDATVVPETQALSPTREPFAPGTRSRQSDVHLADDGPASWPLVITAEKEWSYSVDFPVVHPAAKGRSALVTIDLTVLRGEIGVGLLETQDKALCEAFRSIEDGQTTISLFAEDFSLCTSMIVRNGPTPGRSVAQIHNVSVVLDARVPKPPTLVISGDTFTRYPTWSGTIPPGYTGDWLGVLTRGGVESSSLEPANAQALLTERHGSFEPPTNSELLLDWEPLLAAVELSGAKFTAVALGAGWGRWIVGCAVAAQKRGRDYYIVGVEAEPQHFRWMERHLQDNNIPPEKSRLIHAAANSYTGTCWFMVGNAIDWYGQAVVSDSQYRSAEFQSSLKASGGEAEATPCVDLNEVFAGLDRVDYLHMDIQGSEADVLLACPDLLDERVAVINVGTHSELIERRLRRHFTQHGWVCRYDIPMNGTIFAALEGKEPNAITVGDGVFVWENPRLTGRTEIEPFVVPTLIRTHTWS